MDSTTTTTNNIPSQSQSEDKVLDFTPFFRIYKDGKVERLMGTLITPASTDPSTGVQSKDIVISPGNKVSARLYIPQTSQKDNAKKLPLLVYFHGGGFVVETPFSPAYHHYLNKLVAEANVVAVSVDYRRAPEHFLPAAYDDSWEALQWVSAHASRRGGDEKWLNDYVDFDRVFMAGDSAGANIAHNMALRAGLEKLNGVNLEGMYILGLIQLHKSLSYSFASKKVIFQQIWTGIILVHPYFWGKDAIGNEAKDMAKKASADQLWLFLCPTSSGNDDPLINPLTDMSKLSSLACSKVLVCVAEKDTLRDRNWAYFEGLKKSGWGGRVEIFSTEAEDHIFHLFNPACENAAIMMNKVVSFLNGAGDN